MTRGFIALLAVFLLASCTHFYKPLRIDEIHYPYGQLRKVATQALPIGLRSTSQNGRELLSQYFVIQKKKYVEAIENPTRYTAKLVLLGERRPYLVEIYVFKEARTNVGGRVEYKVVGQDLRIAMKVKKELQTLLAQRREDLNIIDDFRVF